MQSRRMLFLVFSGIVACALNLQSASVRTSAQESTRDRTRDEWQRPAEVFDALGLEPGYRVADLGSGTGYFTFRLAAKVGTEGRVYAIDIDPEAIDKVRQRKEREKLGQVESVLGESTDAHLPNELDAVLIVDSYHEFYFLIFERPLPDSSPGPQVNCV